MWDGIKKQMVNSHVIVILNTMDAVALTELDGCVGHHSAQGCRLGCDIKRRHKPSSGHYYAAHLHPNSYAGSGCDHLDINIRNLSKPSPGTYVAQLAKVVLATD